jgi:glycosyltransferase involved in cell wall biosynthesis
MSAQPAETHILFFDKVLIHNTRQTVVGGAELFNLSLVRDLAELGYQVTLLLCVSWKPHVQDLMGRSNVRLIFLPPIRVAWINAFLILPRLLIARLLGARKYDYCFLSNVGKAVAYPARTLFRWGCFERLLIVAHRTATPYFLSALKDVPSVVVSANEQIADQFSSAGFARVENCLGVVNAERYSPREEETSSDTLNFAVFGSLDNRWKGADTAVEAFLSLPERVRERSHLHLAGYAGTPPTFDCPQITAYSWLSKDEAISFLRSMDVLLVPSYDEDEMKETFSLSMVEGMLCGLPLVTSNLPVFTEKLDEGGGLTYRTLEEFVAHMTTLFDQPEIRARLANEARSVARKRYVWNTSTFLKNCLLLEA